MEETTQESEQSSQPAKSDGGFPMKGVGALVLLAIGGYFVFTTANKSSSTTPKQTDQNVISKTPTQNNVSPSATTINEDESTIRESSVKTFEVNGRNFSFSLKEIKVKQGDILKIAFSSQEGLHDFVIDEFDVRTKQIQAGQTDEIQFLANKKGTFEFYCSIGQHRKLGMVGKLIVD